MVGRVSSVYTPVFAAAGLLSAGLAGVLGAFIGITPIFAAFGVVLILAGLFGWFTLREKRGGTL
jgi:predicted metal-binding membrane protein